MDHQMLQGSFIAFNCVKAHYDQRSGPCPWPIINCHAGGCDLGCDTLIIKSLSHTSAPAYAPLNAQNLLWSLRAECPATATVALR